MNTVREQLRAWGVDVNDLMSSELDVEAVDGQREGRLARAWVEELGREILRRRRGRSALADRQRAEREALAERHRREREAVEAAEDAPLPPVPPVEAPAEPA